MIQRKWSMSLVVLVAAVVAAALLLSPTASLAQLPPEDIVAGVATASQRVTSFSGVVTYEQSLVPLALLGEGHQHISDNREYRVWYQAPSQVRIEELWLGGTLFVSDGETTWTYSSGDNTVIIAKVRGPDQAADPFDPQRLDHLVDQIAAALEESSILAVSTGRVAGQDAYRLEVAPRDADTLLGIQTVAVDGTPDQDPSYFPLSYSIATRSGQVVGTIMFTEISYEPVDESLFTFTPQPVMTVVRDDPSESQHEGDPSESVYKDVTLEEARGLATFSVRTPSAVPGDRTLTKVSVATSLEGSIVLLHYGRAWGSVLLVETDEQASGDAERDGEAPIIPEEYVPLWDNAQAILQSVTVGDQPAKLLSTGLFSALAWREDGISYFTAGSFKPDALLALANSLE